MTRALSSVTVGPVAEADGSKPAQQVLVLQFLEMLLEHGVLVPCEAAEYLTRLTAP